MTEQQIIINQETLPNLGLYSYEAINDCVLPLIVQQWNVWKKETKNVIVPKGLIIDNSDLRFGEIQFMESKYNWDKKVNETSYPISLESGETFVKNWGWFATIDLETLNNVNLFQPYIDTDNSTTMDRLLYIKAYNRLLRQGNLDKVLEIGRWMRDIRDNGFEDTKDDLIEIKSELEEIKDIDYDIITDKIERTIKDITESLNETEVSEDHRYFRGCFIYDFSIYYEQFLTKPTNA